MKEGWTSLYEGGLGRGETEEGLKQRAHVLGLDSAQRIGIGSISGLKSLPCCLWAGTCSAGGGGYCFQVGECIMSRPKTTRREH